MMDRFEQENFVKINQFEALLRSIERNNYEHNKQIDKLTNDLNRLRNDFESRIDILNKMSLFQFIKLKFKKERIC